jgi:hypothetical protein
MKGIWIAHKELYQLTTEVIIKKRYELIPELEDLLRNRKNHDLFLRILKNPVSFYFNSISLQKYKKNYLKF